MKKYSLFILLFTVSNFHILGQATAADFTEWRLPEGAFARLGKGIVKDIAYSPDGKHLAVASPIGVWIYDTQTGNEQAQLTANTENARWIAAWNVVFSPDGQTLAVLQGEVLLWDTQTYTLKGTLKGHSYSVTDAAFSPDGQILAIADMDQTTQLWDMKTMALKCTLEGSTSDINHEGMLVFSVAYSPMGDTFAICSEDDTIRLWDTTTGKLKHTLIGNNSFSFSPDGKTIATQSFSNRLWLWDTTTGRHKSTIKAYSQGTVAYSPDGDKIATISEDNILLWNATTGEMQSILDLDHEMGQVINFLFSPDGNKIAIVKRTEANEKTVSLWDTASDKLYEFTAYEECGDYLYSDVPLPAGKHKYTLGNAEWSVESIAFSPDGGTFAMVNTDGVVQLWNTETGELTHTIEHNSSVVDVSFSKFSNFNDSPNRNNNLITVYSKNDVRMWNTNTQLCKHTFKLTKHAAGLKSVAFSPDGNTLATASLDRTDGNLHFWEIPSGMFKETLAMGKYTEFFVGPFSPDGKTLAILVEKELKLFGIAPASLKIAFNAKDYIRSIAYTPDGKTIAVGMREMVELWKTTTGKLIDTIKCDYQLKNVAFSPDGKILAIGMGYNTLLYDAKTRIQKHILDGDGTILKFSVDGKTLANGGSNGIVFLSDTETGTQKYKLTGHVGTVTGVAFCADSDTIATAGEDGTVLLWNLTSQHLNLK